MLKTDGALRDWAYRRIGWLLAGVARVLVAAFMFALDRHLRVIDRWVEAPWLLIFPVLGALAVVGLWLGARRQRDGCRSR